MANCEPNNLDEPLCENDDECMPPLECRAHESAYESESMPSLEPRDYETDDDNEDSDEIYGQETESSPAEAINTIEQLAMLQQWSEKERNDRISFDRMKWQIHVEQLLHEGLFVNEYTMSHGAHSELVKILRPYLQRKE